MGSNELKWADAKGSFTMNEQEIHYLRRELTILLKSDDSALKFLEDVISDGIWFWDLEKPENEWFSPDFWHTLGYKPSDMQHLSKEWQGMIHPDDLEIVTRSLEEHYENPQLAFDEVVRYRHKSGSTVWIRCRGIATRGENGKPLRMLGIHQNVTPFKLIEQRYKKNLSVIDELYNSTKLALEEAESLFDLAADAMLQIDHQGYVVRANQEAKMLFGYTAEELIDISVDTLLPEEYQAKHSQHREQYQQNPGTRSMTKDNRCVSARNKSGEKLLLDIRLRPINNRYGNHVLATISDVSDYNKLSTALTNTMQKNKLLAIDATTDPLTTLYNRRYFHKNADREFANSQRYKNAVSLILFDIDDFKSVNDQYSHALGDKVLQQVAKVATDIIRTGDTVARFGGDEFVVLLPMTSSNATEVFAERIRQKIEALSFQVESTTSLGITISAGIATRQESDLDIHNMLKRADKALFKAKAQGRNCVMTYESLRATDASEVHNNDE
ncbi:MAG: diguanylate cyclase (GGDEF)-like protein/PAS domain S-box-containing protein [Paraglaciecola sp.]|jgi:diguanylate cyclase (GGDEF)-like protein/PAS domain S-box-containing protein